MSPPPDKPMQPEGGTVGSTRVLARLDTVSVQLNTRLDDMAGNVERAMRDSDKALRRTAELELRLKKRPTMQKVLITIGGCVAVIIALVWNVTWLVSTRTADTNVKAVEQTLGAFEKKIEARIQASTQVQQQEHRELYEAAPKKKRSPLLEKPVPKLDGGTAVP